MKLDPQDTLELKGFLRGKGLTIDCVAHAVGQHRTTISKKLSGAIEITPCDLVEMGVAVGQKLHQPRTK